MTYVYTKTSKPMDAAPHPSHQMGEWYQTICDPIERFGRYRECLNCGWEEVICGGAGSHWMDNALELPCEGVDTE